MSTTPNVERVVHRPEFELVSVEELRAYQERRLLGLVRHAWETNEFYRDKWRDAGVDVAKLQTAQDVRKAIPLIEKKDFVGDQAEHPPFGQRIEPARRQGLPLDFYTTSGTSGQGTEIHAQTDRELSGMIDSYGYGLTWSGLHRGDVVALTLPVTMFAGGRCEMQGAAGTGLAVLPLGNYDAARKLAVIEQFEPRGLIGSTSYLAHLGALHAQPSALGVDTLLTGLEAASLPYLHRLEDQWNARAFDRFGCAAMRADFMFSCEYGVGTEQRPGVLHNIEPNVWLEVIDPATGRHVNDGEYGELVVTSLYNRDTPLVRCRLRDGGIYRAAGYCRCGRPFGGVDVASISRMDDVKKIKGVNVYPQALEEAVLASPEIEEYEVVLSSTPDATDIATVTVMLKRHVALENTSALTSTVAHALHSRLGIHFSVKVGELERSEYKARRWRDERVR